MNQLDPKATWYFFFAYMKATFGVILFLTILGGSYFARRILSDPDAFSETFGFSPLVLFLLVLLILSFQFIWARLTYRYYLYELREDGFRKEHGIIYKKYVTIPYDRIQNVDIDRGLLARLLGLSDLKIHTAGETTTGSEGRLPGLSKEAAEVVRDQLAKRLMEAKRTSSY